MNFILKRLKSQSDISSLILPDSLKSNAHFFSLAIPICPSILSLSSVSLRHNKSLILLALQESPEYVKYADKELLENREFLEEILRNDGFVLEFLG
jgi:hypothetical protein